MNKIFNFLFVSLMLFGCVASASSIKNKILMPEAQIVEQDYDEMLELAKEMDQERIPAIYVVIISEPEIITAKPPEK